MGRRSEAALSRDPRVSGCSPVFRGPVPGLSPEPRGPWNGFSRSKGGPKLSGSTAGFAISAYRGLSRAERCPVPSRTAQPAVTLPSPTVRRRRKRGGAFCSDRVLYRNVQRSLLWRCALGAREYCGVPNRGSGVKQDTIRFMLYTRYPRKKYLKCFSFYCGGCCF